MKTLTNPLIGQVNKSVLPVIINNEKEWKFKDILDTKNYQYKI